LRLDYLKQRHFWKANLLAPYQVQGLFAGISRLGKLGMSPPLD
jgi:hypothetical protein